MFDPTYPLFPVFAFLGFVLCLIPLPWHLQALNSGTCYFMIWTSLACLNQFINSVVWANNALDPAPWWCEISIRILMGASVAIPVSSLCIVRRLYKIARIQVVSITHAEKRRAVIIDSLICVLFPLIYIALQTVVQGHRYNVIENIGCYPAVYNTLVTYFISLMWPIVIGLISAVYCILALYEFNKRRLQFNQFLNATTALTVSRYFRLMALAMVETMCTTPLAAFVIWLNLTTTHIAPWVSWSDTHFDYWRVEQIPRVIWQTNHLLIIAFELTRWSAPFCAILFFCFFGFAQEARSFYIKLFKKCGNLLRLRSSNTTFHRAPEKATLPPFPREKQLPSATSSTFSDMRPSYDQISVISTRQSSLPPLSAVPLSPLSITSFASDSTLASPQ